MKLNIKKIQLEMGRQGITSATLAKKINKSNRAVLMILKTGKTKISTINDIGEALAIDPKDLLT